MPASRASSPYRPWWQAGIAHAVQVLLPVLAAGHAGAAGPVAGQSLVTPHYRDSVRQYGSADGLPQSSITALLQDHAGYLWLGTYGGLARFDGDRFQVHRSLALEGPGSDRILSLLEDARQRLWVGTEDSGLSLYAQGRFQRLPHCAERCRVAALLPDGAGVLAATSDGLLALGPEPLQAARLQLHAVLTHGATLPDGRRFVAGPAGLWQLTDPGAVLLAGPPAVPWSAPTFLGVVDGVLVIGLADDLYRWQEQRWQAFDPTRRWPAVTAAIRDPVGRLWLSELSGRTGRGQLEQQSTGAAALDQTAVQAQLVDREQNLWLGSNGRGLFRVRPARIARLDDRQARFDLPGLPLLGDGAGGMWFGLVCDGLRHVDAQGRWRAWPTLGALRNGCPWSFHRNAGGRLYIGTADGQVGWLDGPDQQVEHLASWPGKAIVRAIHPAAPGQLFVAVGTSTLQIADTPASAGSSAAAVELAALAGMRINRIEAARAGGHWFLGDQGVLRLVDGQVVERWGPQQGLASRFARTLLEEPDGTLWIGTYGGGLHHVRAGRLHQYGEHNGLYENIVSCILEDAAGRLWLSGNRGISMLGPEQRRLAARGAALGAVGFAAEDGLDPAETNGGAQPACHRDAVGRLWFPLVSGFAMIEPEHAVDVALQPPLPRVEQVLVGGQPLDLAQPLVLQPGTRNLEIRYSAPSLTAPEKTRFRFRLSAADSWVDAGSQRTVHYPLLPWGELRFEVAARVAGGPWSSPPARLLLAHPRPWYRHPLLPALLLLAALGVAWSGRRALAWYLRRRAAHESRHIRHQAEQLARDNQRLNLEARLDGLTGIANRRQFEEALQAAAACERPLSLLLVDIDQFKYFNDQFGHPAGDACLRSVAAAMSAAVGCDGPHLLARYGGEEFALLLPGIDRSGARHAAETLQRAVAALGLPHAAAASHPYVSISIGLATLPAGVGQPVGHLVAQADQGLYRAKHGGRNRIEEVADDRTG